jgi:hypothetical protein
VRVFLADIGYVLYRGSLSIQFAGGGGTLGGLGSAGDINIYNVNIMNIAERIHDVLDGIVTVHPIRPATVAGDSVRQEFWKASGIDIEVVL